MIQVFNLLRQIIKIFNINTKTHKKIILEISIDYLIKLDVKINDKVKKVFSLTQKGLTFSSNMINFNI